MRLAHKALFLGVPVDLETDFNTDNSDFLSDLKVSLKHVSCFKF